MNNEASARSSFSSSVKHAFKNRIDQLKKSQHLILEIVIAFGIGFLLGFLFKRFANLVVAFVLFVIGLIILHHFEIVFISFNMIKIEEIFGIKHAPMSTDFFSTFWLWVKHNVALTVSFIIGVILGLKLA